ncbi:MAG: DsbA family protein [bacterium]
MSEIETKETVLPSGDKEFSPVQTIAYSLIISSIIIAISIIVGSNNISKSLSSGSVDTVKQAQNTNPGQPGAANPIAVASRTGEPVLGNPNAKVTIVEFADFQCPYCQRFFKDTFPKIKKDYVDTGKAKIVFRHFPLTSLHVNAQIASVAAECANQQGKFWEYHDTLYASGQGDGTGLDKASLEKYADQLGLNAGTLGLGKNKFNQCVESNATLSIVQADEAEGTKDGVNSTPSIFINGKLIVGAQPYNNFQQAIDAALK